MGLLLLLVRLRTMWASRDAKPSESLRPWPNTRPDLGRSGSYFSWHRVCPAGHVFHSVKSQRLVNSACGGHSQAVLHPVGPDSFSGLTWIISHPRAWGGSAVRILVHHMYVYMRTEDGVRQVVPVYSRLSDFAADARETTLPTHPQCTGIVG